MLLPTIPAWGRPTLFRLGTDQTFPISYTPTGASCQLEFGRELVCELRPHGPETEGSWRFGLHQLLEVPAGTWASVRYELRLFVYKPAGAVVTVQLKTARAGQALHCRPETMIEDEQHLTLRPPLAQADGGLPLWLDVAARRPAGAGQVLVTLDLLHVALEAVAPAQ
jgi:hypothetical protein